MISLVGLLLAGPVICMDPFTAYSAKLINMNITELMAEIHRCYYKNDACPLVISDLPEAQQDLLLATGFGVQVAKFKEQMKDPNFDQKGEKIDILTCRRLA